MSVVAYKPYIDKQGVFWIKLNNPDITLKDVILRDDMPGNYGGRACFPDLTGHDYYNHNFPEHLKIRRPF